MKGKDMISGMSFVDERFINEAETGTIMKTGKTSATWKRCAVMVASLAVVILTAFSVLPNFLNQQNIIPPDGLDNFIADNPNNAENTPPITSEIHISMENIFLNELGASVDAARRWYDPELYDNITWDKEAIIAYYGKDLTPSYRPDGLTAASGNETTMVIADKEGKIVEDSVSLSYYHAYYEDGSPKQTENVAATKGFYVLVSRLGIIQDCIYLLPENEVKTSNIGGVEVTFGYRSMPYGPYDPDTHEPSGHYDMYVAEFEQDEIEYQIVANQIEIEELVKVVSSIIYGKSLILDK